MKLESEGIQTLTSRRKIILEKLIAAQMAKKFPDFTETKSTDI
jgi:hypothetical protein